MERTSSLKSGVSLLENINQGGAFKKIKHAVLVRTWDVFKKYQRLQSRLHKIVTAPLAELVTAI